MTTILDRTFLGIEFTDDSVVLALLKNSVSGMALLASGTIKLKEESDDTVNEARDFINRQGVAISNVFVSIPDSWAMTKFIDIPSVKGRSKNAVANLMKFEIERHIPFPIETVSYDFLILKKKAASFTVVFAAVQNEKVDRVKDFLEKLALRPHSITLASFAVLSSMELSGVPVGGLQEIVGITRRSNVFADMDETVVSLLINGQNATLSIIREGFSVYMKTLEISADSFARTLSESGKKLSIERFDKLLVTGEATLLKDLTGELKEKLEAENVAFGEISEFNGTVHGKEMKGLAASVGACFSGLGIGTHRINILPHQREYEIKRMAPMATKAFMFLAVAMLIGIFAAGVLKQKDYIEKLDAALEANEPAVKALENVTSDIDLLEKQSKILYELKRTEIALEVLAELTSILPSESWVTNLHYKGFDIKGKKEGGELVINGFASSSSILIPLLEDSDYFEKVEFVGPIKKKGLKEQFRIKAVVLVPSDKEKG
jgi:Tfp pilus assembly PilM family ATPase/Tfp pilus assembly protein PilN